MERFSELLKNKTLIIEIAIKNCDDKKMNIIK